MNVFIPSLIVGIIGPIVWVTAIAVFGMWVWRSRGTANCNEWTHVKWDE